MEFWARWAHRALWHASLWNMHESHHRPREGPFELNDVFAIINAVPAIGLLAYGFFTRGFVPGLCFGAVSSRTAESVCPDPTVICMPHGAVNL
jgi:beta-carotene 3-hydroxylase